MIAKIKRMYVRHYRDNGQDTLYIEWTDSKGKFGRTECNLLCECCGQSKMAHNAHMQALLARGQREGVRLEHETW